MLSRTEVALRILAMVVLACVRLKVAAVPLPPPTLTGPGGITEYEPPDKTMMPVMAPAPLTPTTLRVACAVNVPPKTVSTSLTW